MRFKRIEIIINVLFWVLITYLVVSKARIAISSEVIDGKTYFTYVRSYERMFVFFLAQVFFISFFYIELYLISRLKKPKEIRGFVLKSLFLFFITPILYLFLVQKVLYPDNEVSDKLNALASSIIYYMTLVIPYGFTKKWIKQEGDKKQLELVKNQAELSLLRRQLQPHFLFNTLNNLMAMVNQTDNPKLAQGIDKLSGLLRHVVYNTDTEEQLTVAQEIEFIKNFSELHLLRFAEDEIDFKLNVTGDNTSQPLEPGIFLCYVENAFKHGVQPEEKGFIHTQIDVSNQGTIYFSIENSIPDNPLYKEEGGFGIKSTQERLDLAYPDRHSITFNQDTTYKVELTITTHD